MEQIYICVKLPSQNKPLSDRYVLGCRYYVRNGYIYTFNSDLVVAHSYDIDKYFIPMQRSKIISKMEKL